MATRPLDSTPSAVFLEQRVSVDIPCILAEAVDSYTGEILSLERSVDPTDAAVFLALRTVRGSGSAVTDTGQKFAEQQWVDGDMETYFLEESRFALRDLISAGQIRLESVEVQTFDEDRNTSEIWLHYTNLVRQRTGKAFITATSARTS